MLPTAIAANEIAKTEAGKKVTSAAVNALKFAFIIGGVYLGGSIAYKSYKKYRAEKYAQENAGNPNLTAAAIIYNSFSRFELPGFIGSLLPSFNISTDEDALNAIATQITNVKDVANAYKILFDRTLFFDVQNGLSTDELKTFWNIINAGATNTDTTTIYPVGTRLYVASKSGITVNEAVNQNGNWKGTNNLYGNYNYNDLVGDVIYTAKVPQGMQHAGEQYYIVKQVRFNQCVFNCQYGVVIHSQVNNQKI